MHYTYGKIDRSDNGRFMDAVIPNYWDLEDFSKIKQNLDEEPYLFFIGRMIERKGVSTAVMVADKLRMKIKLAGQGLEKVGEHEYVGS
jgi:glycosyltransferase involved in cell wall biosynthesis